MCKHYLTTIRVKIAEFLGQRTRDQVRNTLLILIGTSTWVLYGFMFWTNQQIRYETLDMSLMPVPITEQQLQEREMAQKMSVMVEGHPIESMLPYIVEQDQLVAAYLVSIAKKESNWGERVPVLDGEDCYNYWGYRGVRDRMGSGGHTCFDDPEDAVETVGERIATLVYEYERDTPEEMVYWKCGFGCDTHSSASVQKWIDDVDLYFQELVEEERS